MQSARTCDPQSSVTTTEVNLPPSSSIHPPPIPTKMPPPLLSVKNLTIRRDDGTGSAIFHDVSFDVNEGDVVIIKGRSGAGQLPFLPFLSLSESETDSPSCVGT